MSDKSKPSDPILEIRGISKSFPGVKALDNVSFDVRAGEILAVLGENGAGKSTLMKILSGLYKPDEGTILVDYSWFKDKEVSQLDEIVIEDPRYSMRLGIGMVYQHFQLVEPFSVTENVTLGQEYTLGNTILLDREEGHRQIKQISEEFGLPIDPRAIVENLPVGLKQRVEIIKQLYRKAELLILDEPTAVLTPSEAEELFKTIQKLRDSGKSIIFISHKLKEPLAIADRIVILRKGQMVGQVLPENATEAKLAELVVGKRVQRKIDRNDLAAGNRVLQIDNLSVKDPFSEKTVVDEVSLDVREGEIVGIAGVQGNGQSQLIEAIMGLMKKDEGLVQFTPEGEVPIDITKKSTLDILKLGIGYIPEDRIQRGLILDFNLGENVWMGYFGRDLSKQFGEGDLYPEPEETVEEAESEPKSFLMKLHKKLSIPFEFIHNLAQSIVDQYDIKTPSVDTQIRNLSGGNQQKVIVGREFTKHPRLIVASEPSRGVDVGVMTQIHRELIEQRNQRTAILLISSDLDEVLALSDRLAVMYNGRIVGIRDTEEFTINEISRLMTVGSLEKQEGVTA